MKLSKILNDGNKQLNKINRNYFFAATVFVVLLNITIYAACGSRTTFYQSGRYGYMAGAMLQLLQALVNAYTHANWQHALLNMLCFFIAGLYLERKTGSLRFLLLVFILSLFDAFATSVLWGVTHWHGFSGVNYALYSYIILDFLFVLLQKRERYLANILSGIVILALIYFAMCFSGGTEKVSFEWYPYDLINNWGHVSGSIVGLVFGLYEQVCALISRKSGK